MATMRELILWLAQKEGFRSRIRISDADCFNLSRRDEAEARAAAIALPTLLPPRIWNTKLHKTCACFSTCLVFRVTPTELLPSIKFQGLFGIQNSKDIRGEQ